MPTAFALPFLRNRLTGWVVRLLPFEPMFEIARGNSPARKGEDASHEGQATTKQMAKWALLNLRQARDRFGHTAHGAALV